MPAGSDRSATTAPPGLATAVDELLADGPYRLSALGGSSGRTFLASGPAREVVARLDADVAVLRRVAEIGVGPAVIGAGAVDGRPFVVQTHVRATPAHRPWLVEHIPGLADLVARYQSDAVLAELAGRAGELEARSYARSLVADAEVLSPDLASVAVPIAIRLLDGGRDLPEARAVATHGDPNSENILTAERPLLVDWDDLRLADPMRDIGQLAWWYLPEAAWPAFIAAAGEVVGPRALDRLYWWVAAESLDVALRLAAADAPAAMAFLADARAALDHGPNPRLAR